MVEFRLDLLPAPVCACSTSSDAVSDCRTRVRLHRAGCRDFTDVDDLDIMIDPQIENARKVMSALTASHIDVQFDASTLANPAKLIRVKVLHYWLDLLTPEGGIDFAELRGRAVFATMNEMLVPVVGRDDLIALKEVAASKPDCDAKHKQDLKRLRLRG